MVLEFYSAGLAISEILQISTSTGLSHAVLPVRYLGVPLSSKKFSLSSCSPLIEKVKGRVNSSSVKSLSYAGRLQLLGSVISGIMNFWCSSFVLPAACIKQITSICRAFLWKGSLEGRHAARVSWNSIALPKDEGGLGLKQLTIWNKACSLRFIWMLFFKPSSIWSTKFWTDNWSGLGSIASYLPSEICHALGIHRRSLIADLNQDGEWNIQRLRGSLVPWVAQIWFSGQIPRHSFLAWLFMRDRCPTRDRLLSWGINTDPLCLLCNSSPESRNHLFFACNFSFAVWGTVCSRLLLHPYRSWDQTNLQLQSLSGTSNHKLLPHLAWQATIYTLWLERNARLHHRLSSAPDAVFLKIDKVIRHRALSFKSNNPRRTSTILNRWFLL